jgi:hypothetical protein
MKNVKLKFNDTWVDVEDGWLCIGDSENQILLKPKFFNKLLEAINYTPCCEELKDKKAMTFEEWVESEGYTEKWDGYFKNGIKFTYWIVKGKYVMYTNELNL